MIGNIKKTTEILKRHDLYAKKRFGQNFLIDENIFKKIIELAQLNEDVGVVEVGPGIGGLTEHLVKKAKKVLAFEIDTDMVNVLGSELSSYSNLKVMNKDFLNVNLTEDLEFLDDCSEVVMVANLPYYITTPIITKLIEENSKITKMYLMVQKEVGDRLSAKPKTKDYNALSVFMEYKSKTKVEIKVSPNSFWPAPKVDSVVISVLKVKSDYSVKNERKFMQFIRACFIQKRKTLFNNLSSSFPQDKEKIRKVLNELNYLKQIRGEELSLKELHNIYINLFED